jgi:hypothetical protein
MFASRQTRRTRENNGARGMPGTLVGTVNWKSSFNPRKDGDDLCLVIKNAWSTPYAGLTVFFLAEMHRHAFDVMRSEIVFEEFSKQQYAKRLCLVVERGLFQEYVNLPHFVYEGLTDLGSRDPKRNDRIVFLVKEYRKETPATILIFFYGEEHLEPIKSQLIADQPTGTNIRWISSLSFDTVFNRLEFNERARFETSVREPAGYASCNPRDQPFGYLQALTKGQWFTRFMTPLYSREQARWAKYQGKMFAIYFKDAKKNAQVKSEVDGEGAMDYVFETFDGADVAVAELVTV